MKTKILFFCLLVLSTITSFGQTITLTTTGYDPVVISKSEVVNIRSNTQLTIVASGLGETYWTVDKELKITETPTNPVFPNTSPTNNTVIITIPSIYDDFVLTVYFASPTVSIPITFVRNNNSPIGLLTQQNVKDCPNTTRNFIATDPYQTGFAYQWQEWNGSWINVTNNSNYSFLNHTLTLQVNSSTVGKRFRAMVKNEGCLGAIDYTEEVLVIEVYQLPIASVSIPLTDCVGTTKTMTVTYSGGSGLYDVSLIDNIENLVTGQEAIRSNVSAGTQDFVFNVVFGKVDYTFTVLDKNTGCLIQ